MSLLLKVKADDQLGGAGKGARGTRYFQSIFLLSGDHEVLEPKAALPALLIQKYQACRSHGRYTRRFDGNTKFNLEETHREQNLSTPKTLHPTKTLQHACVLPHEHCCLFQHAFGKSCEPLL